MPAPFPHGLEGRIAALEKRSVHDPRNQDVRDIVRLRALDACEYCLMPTTGPTTGKFHVEHIVARGNWRAYQIGTLRGPLRRRDRLLRASANHIANYAWSCSFCNEGKSNETMGRYGGRFVRFFDPRYDNWPDHFAFLPSSEYGVIVGVTPIGEATVEGLGFNDGGVESPLATRYVAIIKGMYPPVWARAAYKL
jgi:hypothetical protein